EGARQRVKSTELDIIQNVEQAEIAVEEAQERIQAAQALVASAQENFRLAQGRFDAGVGTILELTDAQLALTQAQNTEAQAPADSATGNLNAVITVQVGSQVSGQIKALFVDFNSIVKKGQVVARIDPDIFEAKVNQAKADLDSAKAAVLNQQAQIERSRADVDNARAAHAEARAQTAKAQVAVVDTKRDLDRKTELFARQLIAKSDLDSSQAAYDSAGAQLDSARAH